MAAEFELLGPSDKPALLGLSDPTLQGLARKALEELGYKVHTVANHAEFLARFAQIQYQVVVLEELFNASTSLENRALTSLQSMPMAQRRAAVSLLFGRTFQTLHPMQAFQQSVHAVINTADTEKLGQIVAKVVADHALLYGIFRDAQLRLAQGK
ncbi:MAG: hypothetical protein HY735_03750 [Verrucomicrobia bacterium]|nr:hypothetical protein [Verrucomicrobiota bacterium]